MVRSDDGFRSEFEPAIYRTDTARATRRYVLRYRFDLERTLCRVLEHIGIDYTILTYQRRLPRNRGIVTRHWFPGYAFVAFDIANDNWQQMLRAPGALAVLGDPPVPLDDRVFHDLVARCPSILPPGTNDAMTVIAAGSEIEILDGAFAGRRAVVSSSVGDTVWIEMMTFNRPTRMELKTKHVMIVGI